MPEIEDVRAAAKRVKDSLRRRPHRSTPSEKRKRVEIALNWHAILQLPVRPFRIDRFVDADAIDAGLIRISAKLSAGALGKADDRHG